MIGLQLSRVAQDYVRDVVFSRGIGKYVPRHHLQQRLATMGSFGVCVCVCADAHQSAYTHSADRLAKDMRRGQAKPPSRQHEHKENARDVAR
ncbi:hypothetical protein BDV95DRAFT_184325 [Massariosphaeria phaeospora]|uniref:Uncharacterized protein n=1 Tax=Massariosphaeria phaeospora TaxID=100035 RepID=A0A7C8MDZ5_9PLEO|nr:hypothetical protein BDV95DRAFT_184325 [Massariosphaeria phaeospora]